MQQTLISHPKLQVSIRTGSEGPHYDPYSYEELTVKTTEHKVMIHEGLARFIVLDGERFDAFGKGYDEFTKAVQLVLEIKIGYSRSQIERIHRKQKEAELKNCPKGGPHLPTHMYGFPGEHFTVCQKCNKFLDSYFCESEIE